jgi:uncharacterized protein YciI
MFIFILTYQKPLSEVDKHLEAHRAYLDQYYASGHLIVSGGQEPRTGGVILCRAETKEQAVHIMKLDPFYLHQIAQYEVIEFVPTKYAAAFEQFIK